MVDNFFDKKSATHTGTVVISNLCSGNQQLSEELRNRIIRKFKKRKVHLSCKDIIWVLI